MAKDIFFISDTHFGHENFLSFRDRTGFLIRPFDSVRQMDELMIERWNEVVKPEDRVYHLGDVAFGSGTLQRILPKLNGSKRLILGNHDDLRQGHKDYFKKITMWRQFPEHGFVVTHAPLLMDDPRNTCSINVHGHIHEKPDPTRRHINISVERIAYRPVHLDTIKAMVDARRKELDDDTDY